MAMAAQRASHRSAAQDLIYPKPAFRARDHHRDNLRQMRQAQENCRQAARQRDVDASQPLYKDPAMVKVRSRVDTSGHAAAGAAYGNAPAPAKQKGFLQAGSRRTAGPPPAPNQPYVSRKDKSIAAVPTAQETAAETRRLRHEAARMKGEGRQRDFVRRNKDAEERQQAQAAAERKRAAMAKQPQASTKERGEFGKVPEYLQHRKAELEEEKAYLQSMTRTSDIPGGYKQLPEEQRKQLLESLQQAYAQKSVELQRMPLMIESVSRRRRKQELEQELVECERTMKVLSKPVYIEPGGGLTNNVSGVNRGGGPISWERPLQ